MTQPLTEALVEAAREAASADAWERDQALWNFPREGGDPASPAGTSLDWAGFSEAYYPGSRRHDLRAIAAYAAYRQSTRSV